MNKLAKKQLTVFLILFIFLGSSISYAILYVFPGGDNSEIIHWHAKLDIYIDGEKQEIPAGVGLGGAELHPAVIHTHEEDHILHKEGPASLTLGNFFEVWEKTFNSECIFEYCSNSTHRVRMTVNNADNSEFGNYVFQDKDIIEIDYARL